jgi:flagellar biosynthetic protein FliR
VALTVASLYAFFLVLLRTAGLAIAIPTWGNKQVPARVRLALVLVLGFAVYQGAGAPQLEPPGAIGLLVAQGIAETAIGLLGGLAARFTLEAAAAAGQMISLATGLSFGALIDPTNGAESNALAEILRMMALCVAIAAGLHREAVLWLIESLRSVPIGGPLELHGALGHALAQSAYCAVLAVRIAFPVLALVGMSYLALGAAGRVVPQLGLQNLGFSIALLVGGGAVYAMAPEAAHRVGQLVAQSFR